MLSIPAKVLWRDITYNARYAPTFPTDPGFLSSGNNWNFDIYVY